jgi:hypothetical protein
LRLDWALLADSAQVRGGLAFILAAGIDTIRAPSVPFEMEAAVVVRLLLHRTEAETDHVVEVRVLDEDGAELVADHRHIHAHLPADLPVGWDIPVQAVFPIRRVLLPREALYSVEVLGDRAHLKSLPLRLLIVG